MKNKLWLFQLPIIVIFTAFFWVTELGVQGKLQNAFLRESFFPTLSRATNILTDLKFKSRGPKPAKNKIVVVEIDSPAIDTLGRWPWHRDVLSYLLEKILLAGAKVVGLDIVFSESDTRVPVELAKFLRERKFGHLIQQFETDRQLEDVLRRYPDQIVMGWMTELQCQPLYEDAEFCPVTHPDALAQFPKDFDKFSIKNFQAPGFDPTRTPLISFVTPIANIAQYNSVAKHSGYLNAFLDSDGYIRRTSLAVMAGGKPFPSMALEMARAGLNENIKLSLDSQHRVKELSFEKQGRSMPVTPLGSLQINFRGGTAAFPHLPALDVMSEKDEIEDAQRRILTGKSKRELLKDAYVLVGLTALGVFDMRQFPFEANSPGVDGHANILDNLLVGDPLIPGSHGAGTFWVLLMMVLGVGAFSIAMARLDAVPALLLFLVLFAGFAYSDFSLLFSRNYNWNTSLFYMELTTVFFLSLAGKYVLEERNKKFIRSAFSKYVPPTVVDAILKDPAKLSLGGEKRELTILFSDIRSFTTFSEKMDAKSLAAFLNDYLGIMTGLVFSNQGTLDKYIGDAVMAFWGAPLNQPEHAANACKAAVDMMGALVVNQQRFKTQYGIDVNIGIGINSGVVNVGNMGSEQNFEYTVIGDHVNLASRLEGLTKSYGAGILTSRFTFDAITRAGKTVLPHRVLDDVKVKGKKTAIELIQLLEREYSAEGLKLFTEARDLYRKQKWDEATRQFEAANALLRLNPDSHDGPCRVFLERCKFFKAEPPAADWDGSWEMHEK